MYGANLAAQGILPTITISGLIAPILYGSAGQVNLLIPPGLAPGPQILQLNNGAANAYPVLVNIDTPPAGIDAHHPEFARAGTSTFRAYGAPRGHADC